MSWRSGLTKFVDEVGWQSELAKKIKLTLKSKHFYETQKMKLNNAGILVIKNFYAI
jgi:hypothetical protein